MAFHVVQLDLCCPPLQLDKYHGEAINPKYLSLYERWRGYGRHYDPQKDLEQKRLQGIE